MKRIIALCAVVALLPGIGFAQKQQKNEKKQEVIEFTLKGEICQNCKKKIDGNIAFEKGVTDITYCEDGKSVQISYNATRTDPEKLKSAFEKVQLEVVEAKPVEKTEKVKKMEKTEKKKK